MEKLLLLMNIFFAFLISTSASAYPVTDVKAFDRTIKFSEPALSWEYDLADYGFLLGHDILVGLPKLTFEFRDPKDLPDKDLEDRPLISVAIDQSKLFTRVLMEDYVIEDGSGLFNEQGKMPVYISLQDEDVWLGKVILSFDFIPEPTRIPEPAPLALIGLGLLAVGLRQRKLHKLFKK